MQACCTATATWPRNVSIRQQQETTSPAKADIWSVGICLLNILFARNPFTPTGVDLTLLRITCAIFQSFLRHLLTCLQDTYEIRSCPTIDPSRGLYLNVRDCILRAVSFTTDDESLDEFVQTEGGFHH